MKRKHIGTRYNGTDIKGLGVQHGNHGANGNLATMHFSVSVSWKTATYQCPETEQHKAQAALRKTDITVYNPPVISHLEKL